MPDNKEYYDLLYAYTLGCLDKEELEKIKKIINTDENFPWQELGEFQNLSALLPSILAIESPAQEVKDKVARKLYRIRQEIKAKRDSRKNAQKKNEQEKAIEQEQVKIIEEPLVEEKTQDKFIPDVEEFEIVSPKPVTEDQSSPDKEENKSEEIETTEVTETVITSDDEMVLDLIEGKNKVAEDEIDTTSMTEEDAFAASKTAEDLENERHAEEKRLKKRHRYSDRVESDKKKKKKGSLPLILAFITLFIIIVTVVFLYYKATIAIKKYEAEIISLNREFISLNDQYRLSRELQTILNSKNLLTIDMAGTKTAPSAFGKLFVSSDLNKGYLQLTNFVSLPDSQVYQLWISLSGNYLPLLKFNSAENISYFPFEAPQINANTKAIFIITSAPEGESEKPGKNVLLEGRVK